MTRDTSLRLWNRLRAWLSQWRSTPEDDPELRAFADRACAHCVAWFGQPVDPKKPYVLARGGKRSWCSYGPRCYRLVISDRCKTRGQRLAAVAHEMYHRVSWLSGGIRRYQSGQAWLEELLACQACDWVLEEEGISYAVTRRDGYLQQPERINTRRLRTFDSLLFRFCLNWEIIYPKHFYASVTRLGYALHELVGREHLSRLGQSRSLKAWVESLPPDLQAPIRTILGLSRQPPSLEHASSHYRFGRALAAIGDREAAITEVQEAIRLQPGTPRFYQTLGYICYGSSLLEEAIVAWKIAAFLDETGADASYNAAGALASQGEVVAAVAWFREAARRQPGQAMYQFYLGRALAETGDWVGARTAWEKVLTLGDEQYGEPARQALQENPLPVGTAGE